MNNNQTDDSVFDINKWAAFLFMCIASILLLIIKKTFVENQTAAFEVLALSEEMAFFKMVNTLQYFSVPLIYLAKFTIISFIIWVGCFMFGYKLSYGQTWQVVAVAESIFLIPEVLKILYFTFIESDPNLFDIGSFYPLSLINLTDPYELSKRWFYPLKALNIFEVIYWFILVAGIHHMAHKKKSIAYGIVFSSYVLFFMIWLGFYLIVYK